MTEALTALAQEPWCFHPDQIARLTDWQVVNLYLKPAAKRADAMRREMKRSESPGYTPNSITSLDSPMIEHGEPTREQIILAAQRLGKDVGKVAAAYDARKRRGS